MSEIILPIKCSTVKKATPTLENIIGVEILILGIEWAIYSIWAMQMFTYYPNHEVTQHIDSGTAAIGLLIGIVILSLSVIWIYENLPSLGCIKDDEQHPRQAP